MQRPGMRYRPMASVSHTVPAGEIAMKAGDPTEGARCAASGAALDEGIARRRP